jgi:hypothetical protein
MEIEIPEKSPLLSFFLSFALLLLRCPNFLSIDQAPLRV